MRKLTFTAFMLVAVVLPPLLQACLDKDDNPEQSVIIGTINVPNPAGKEFHFTLDDGKTMFPSQSEGLGDNKLTDGQRAFVIFNQLDQKVAGYDYNIRLLKLVDILTKDIETLNAGNAEKIGDDKINATYMWITQDRKYLTIEFQYYGTHREDKKHLLNLVINNMNHEMKKSDGNEYVELEFRHNSEGDAPERLGEGYVSFKMNRIKELMKDKKGLRIRVNTIYTGEKFYEVKFPATKVPKVDTKV